MDAIKTLRDLVTQREHELETIKSALAILESGSGGRTGAQIKAKTQRAKPKAKQVSRRLTKAKPEEGTAKHEVVSYLKTTTEPFTRASLYEHFSHIPQGTIGSIVTELKEKKQILHVDYDTTSSSKPRELYKYSDR